MELLVHIIDVVLIVYTMIEVLRQVDLGQTTFLTSRQTNNSIFSNGASHNFSYHNFFTNTFLSCRLYDRITNYDDCVLCQI